MTAYGRQHEYDDILRAALQTAGDSIQPGADGFDKISHRLTAPQPLPVALTIGWLDWLYRSLTVTLPSAAAEAWEALLPARKRGRHAAAWIINAAGGEARRPVAAAHGGKTSRPSRSPLGRMRPAAAMFVAIFVVAAAGYAFFLVPQTLSGQAISWLPFYAAPAKTAPPHGHGRGAAHGSSGQPGSQPVANNSSSTPATNGSNCSTGKSSGAPASTPPSSPAVSPSPTPSTSTTSPSPSTSVTTSPSPSNSPSAGNGSTSPTTDTSDPTTTGQQSRQSVTRSVPRPGKRKRKHKRDQSCPTAFMVPVSPHGGSSTVSAASLTAAQFTVLSRDPADGSLL